MTIVFKISDNIKNKMIKYYEPLKREKTPPYAIFQATEADTIITLYESGKVMFQGLSADIDANIWIELEKKLNNRIIDIKSGKETKSKEKEEDKEAFNFNKFKTIGSDEVGTGDYFGPIVVTSTYVEPKDINLLQELKVTDSKKITDEAIKKIAPEIMKNIPYSAYVLQNPEYNNIDHEKVNMNKIKAILHNKVLLNLVEKGYPYEKVIVDQFTPEKNYYGYLTDIPKKVRGITFTPRAEVKALSVACASIISRYIFLNEIEKISTELGCDIPKGAGASVDEFAQKLVKEKGFETLNKYAKLNFKNSDKLKN